MAPNIVAIITVVMLAMWHLRTRRHPHWRASSEGRFYVFCGYPAVAIAVYWLSVSPTNTTWEWAVGNVWALAAAVSFVVGFNTLNDGPKRQRAASIELESIADSEHSETSSTNQQSDNTDSKSERSRRRSGPDMAVY